MYAASIGKWVSFEVLLNDSRVDIDLRDGKNLTALELITVLGEEIQVNKAKEEEGGERRLIAQEEGEMCAHNCPV